MRAKLHWTAIWRPWNKNEYYEKERKTNRDFMIRDFLNRESHTSQHTSRFLFSSFPSPSLSLYLSLSVSNDALDRFFFVSSTWFSCFTERDAYPISQPHLSSISNSGKWLIFLQSFTNWSPISSYWIGKIDFDEFEWFDCLTLTAYQVSVLETRQRKFHNFWRHFDWITHFVGPELVSIDVL